MPSGFSLKEKPPCATLEMPHSNWRTALAAIRPRFRRLPRYNFDMQIRKAVITAAGRDQRNLPMQTLFDEHGTERSVLNLVVREAVRAGVGDICIVVWPGDQEPYARLLADVGARLSFVEQTEARG